ncbi:transforming growth factor beta activator LRRC33 [Ambystoma mexicanum]|uniref:transforming growth factor beta activator LRRC33 n=1 Tax=Ambystoma mexicanum TaxID=8296 RepID=UPI0037E73608
MEFASYCISLGVIILAVTWRSKTVAFLPSYHGACTLVHRSADCNRKDLLSVPQDLPANTDELFLDLNAVQSLTNSSLQHYSHLWSLSLRQNNLEIIEQGTFLANRRLSNLNLQDNRVFVSFTVTAAALRSVSTLKELDLSQNSLTEDMVTTLLQNVTSLESLSLSRNFLMRLDSMVFRDLVALKELNLEKNYIYEIEPGTFKAMWKLQRLNLAFNQITCIVDFSLTQLRVLNASYNSIEWFLADESNNDFQLETLDLSSNQLLFFPLLPKSNNLHSLLLSDNRMSFYAKLPNVTAFRDSNVTFHVISSNVTSNTTINIWMDIILGDVSALHFLDMSRNQFRYLPNGFLATMTSLSHLKLNHNCFQTIHLTEQEPPESLVDLDLSHNQILDLQVDPNSKRVLPNLRTFNVSDNRLHRLPGQLLNHMSYITTVDLSHNRLNLCPRQVEAETDEDPSCLDIRNVRSLRHLYLAGCGLVVHHAFSGTLLTHLDLSSNYGALLMGTRPLQDVASTLQSLSLRNTGLSSDTIDADFSQFQSLTTLDLSENSLAHLPQSLSNLRLHTLDLRSNRLQSFPVQVAQQQLGKSLHTLYLSHNPFDCCKMTWWNFLRNLQTIHVPDSWLMTCNYSSDILPVLELPKSILQSCQMITTDTLMYLLLTLPTCLTLLVALLILFLTFKESMLKMVKRRWRRSSGY